MPNNTRPWYHRAPCIVDDATAPLYRLVERASRVVMILVTPFARESAPRVREAAVPRHAHPFVLLLGG